MSSQGVPYATLMRETPSRRQVKVAATQKASTTVSLQLRVRQQSGSTEQRKGVQGLLPAAEVQLSSARLQQRNGSPATPEPQTPPGPHPHAVGAGSGVFSQLGT